jgi:hypothetical protein
MTSFTQVGKGEIGGKAQGLTRLEHILTNRFDKSAFPDIKVDIPWFWVIATDWFDQFMEKNRANTWLTSFKGRNCRRSWLMS